MYDYKNEHYHSKEKCKCEMKKINIPVKTRAGRKEGSVDGLLCEKHKIKRSKTGWEWHWYGGTDNLKIQTECRLNIKL